MSNENKVNKVNNEGRSTKKLVTPIEKPSVNEKVVKIKRGKKRERTAEDIIADHELREIDKELKKNKKS